LRHLPRDIHARARRVEDIEQHAILDGYDVLRETQDESTFAEEATEDRAIHSLHTALCWKRYWTDDAEALVVLTEAFDEREATRLTLTLNLVEERPGVLIAHAARSSERAYLAVVAVAAGTTRDDACIKATEAHDSYSLVSK